LLLIESYYQFVNIWDGGWMNFGDIWGII